MSLDKPLAGKVGIVTGVANKRSIAFGIAKAWHEAGAKLIFNYQGERLKDGVIKLVKESTRTANHSITADIFIINKFFVL